MYLVVDLLSVSYIPVFRRIVMVENKKKKRIKYRKKDEKLFSLHKNQTQNHEKIFVH